MEIYLRLNIAFQTGTETIFGLISCLLSQKAASIGLTPTESDSIQLIQHRDYVLLEYGLDGFLTPELTTTPFCDKAQAGVQIFALGHCQVFLNPFANDVRFGDDGLDDICICTHGCHFKLPLNYGKYIEPYSIG